MDKRPISLTILSVLCMVVFIGVVAIYYIPHKPFNASFLLSIFQALKDIFLAFAILSLAGGIGRRILAELHSNVLANITLQSAFGIGLLALVYLIVGLLGLYKTWFAWSLLLVLILIFHQSILKWLGSLAEIRATFNGVSGFVRILAVIMLVIILLRLLEALAPPKHFDALVYHLSLPSKFLEAGKFIFTPENPYWGMPLSAEMLYTWAMGLGGSETAAVLGWFIGVFTLVGLIGVGNSISPRAGWIAAAALLAGESLSSSLSWAYADWSTAFQACAVIIAFDVWRKRRSIAIIVLAGLLAGFAFGFKLTAGVIIPAGWAMIIILGTRKELRRALVAFTLAASVVALIWLGKNMLFTGSFLYPFFGQSEWMDPVKVQFFRGTVEPWPILRILLTPLAATIEGVEGAPGFSASMGPLLIGLVLGVPLLRNEINSFIKGLGAFIFVGWIVWIGATFFNAFLGQTRLYFSIFPAWALLAAAGYEGYSHIRISRVRFEKLAGAFIILSLSFSGITNLQDILRHGPTNVIVGLEEDGIYLTRSLGAYYPAMEAVRNLPPDSSVLNLWEPRGFYCMPTCWADVWIDRWYLDRQRYGSAERILDSWREQGFTHVLLYKTGVEFMQENDARYHARDWQVLRELLLHLARVESFGDGYTLYGLVK